MKFNLTELQSYNIDELEGIVPSGVGISGHGDSSFTIHGNVDSSLETIITDYIDTTTRAERQALIYKKEYTDKVSQALQNVMDKDAQSLGYDNIVTAITYSNETAVGSFKADGISFRKWRSLVWQYAYAALAQYEADVAVNPQTVPPTAEELIAGMPVRV